MDWGSRLKLFVVAFVAYQSILHAPGIQAAVLSPPRLPPAAAISPATIFPPSAVATDDAAAISAVATCMQWRYRKPHTAALQNGESYQGQTNPQMQIVGLLPAVGKQSLGGGWEPVEWQGRRLPRRGKDAAFGVRLVQPNIYGVYNYLLKTRQVELWKHEKTAADGRTFTLYELRPVSVWRRFLNNLI